MNNQDNQKKDNVKKTSTLIIIIITFFMIFGFIFLSFFMDIFHDSESEIMIPIVFGFFFVFIITIAIVKSIKSFSSLTSAIASVVNNGSGVNLSLDKKQLIENLNKIDEGLVIAINNIKYTVISNHKLLGEDGKTYDVDTIPVPEDGIYNLSYATSLIVKTNSKFIPASIPSLYASSPEIILKNMIDEEVKKRGFSGTIPKMEKKKNMFSIIFAFIILIETVLIFFHPLNIFFNILLIIITIVIYIIVLNKMNVNNLIAKEIQARPDEDIKMIIASILDDKVSSKKILRIGIIAIAIIIPCLIFMKPRMIYEKNDIGGYSLRYYTIGLINDDIVEIPNTYNGIEVNEIRGETFKNVLFIDEVKLPAKLQEIRGNTFQNSSIKKIIIPDGVTRIGGHAFDGCRNLNEVVIPESVKEIGSSAFRNCDKLFTVTISSDCKVNSRAFKDSPTSIKRYENENNNYNENNY